MKGKVNMLHPNYAVPTPVGYGIYLKNQQPVNFQANKQKSLERLPETDVLEISNKNAGGKIALGVITTAGALAMLDAVACKGKHIKKALETVNKKSKKEAEKLAKEYLQAEEQAIAKAEKKVLESNLRNEAWVKEQHLLKEKEYSEFWNKELAEQEKQVKEFFQSEVRAEKKIIESNKRNEAWVQEQRSLKEKEYSEFWSKELAEKERVTKQLEEEARIKAQQATKEAKAKIEKEFLDTKLNPILQDLEKAENKVRQCYRATFEGEPIQLEEAKRVLDDYLKQKNRLLALQEEATPEVYHLCPRRHFETAEYLADRVAAYEQGQTALKTFEKELLSVFKHETEPFNEGFAKAFSDVKRVVKNDYKSFNESTKLNEKSKKIVEKFEKDGMNIEALKEQKILSEEFSEMIKSLPKDDIRFFEEYHLRMQREFQELVERLSFNDVLINIM